MGTLGKNIEDVREFVGQRVGDMRMQVEDRLGAGVLVGAIAMHLVDR